MQFFQKQPINIGIFTFLYILYVFLFMAALLLQNWNDKDVGIILFSGGVYFILHK
jgi:hypothetical protein